ncbi:MAG: hypothetical protein JSV29_02085 [Candidatus Bathyarchaeota archaeon]|jgi:Arc/MetJ-type ribon-helix-helix transcriptional regulator|nr:MAG: hypothetical protein JSV29_02085 [Candidatus Bathyarchaeota archaeon]
MDIPKQEKSTVLVNFKLHRDVVKVLDRLVESGLYKTRVDVVLSALRIYEPFQKMWRKEVGETADSSIGKV